MKKDTDGQYQTALDFLHDILTAELELNEDRVLFYDDRTKLPTDDGLFILLSFSGAPRVVANRNIPMPATSTVSEYQEVNMQEQIDISVMSRNFEALWRKEEVLMALKSIYAQQVQESNSFKICVNANITDLSELEGAAMIKRYDIRIITFTWYSKNKTVDYYDTFSAELNTENETEIEIGLS